MLYGLLTVIQIALSWASGPPLPNDLLAGKETSTSHRMWNLQSSSLSSKGATGKLKVFILMGQSNMVGFGAVGAPDKKGTLRNLVSQGKYPFLLGDDDANWSVRDDVQIVSRRGSGNLVVEEERVSNLTVGWSSNSNYIGPEIGFGYVIGDAIDDPVLLIKVGTGNRALGWDFRPPGTKRYESNGMTGEGRSFPGYGECPESSLPDSVEGLGVECGVCHRALSRNCPVFWPNSTRCDSCFGWYAGLQFDRDLSNAKAILENLSDYYPDYNEETGFEIAGFVFWQGQRDTETEGHARKYLNNMRKYIKQLWKAYKTYPGKKKFVYASVAFGGCNSAEKDVTGYTPLENMVYMAQRKTLKCRRRKPMCKFKRKVKMIDARPYWRDASISPANERSHYNRNAETYMEVGKALGSAMVDLLFKTNTYVKESCIKN